MRVVSIVMALACASTARADSVYKEHTVSASRRSLAIAVAVGPGFVLRGAGSYVIGNRKRTATRLATVGALGLGGMLASGMPIGVAGAPPVLSIPLVPVLLASASLYVPTWFADIWVAAGLDRHRGFARTPPPYSVELSTTWLHDAYRERGLARAAAQVAFGRLGVGASGMIDAEGDDKLVDATASWRFYGPASTATLAGDTSRFGVRVAVRARRDDVDDVTTFTGDLEVWGRYDLARLDPVLDGTFLDASIGFGIERVGLARDAGVDEHDWNGLSLGRLAWGAYLFDRGEAQIYYDHRRDNMAGGIAAWRAAGFVGSVGTDIVLPIGGPWMLRGELQIGSAWVTTLGVRYHGGLR